MGGVIKYDLIKIKRKQYYCTLLKEKAGFYNSHPYKIYKKWYSVFGLLPERQLMSLISVSFKLFAGLKYQTKNKRIKSHTFHFNFIAFL